MSATIPSADASAFRVAFFAAKSSGRGRMITLINRSDFVQAVTDDWKDVLGLIAELINENAELRATAADNAAEFKNIERTLRGLANRLIDSDGTDGED